MKITNSKQIFLNDNSSLQNGVSPKSDEKFFDARFDELEGLHIEKSDIKEQHQDKNKIYTEFECERLYMDFLRFIYNYRNEIER